MFHHLADHARPEFEWVVEIDREKRSRARNHILHGMDRASDCIHSHSQCPAQTSPPPPSGARSLGRHFRLDRPSTASILPTMSAATAMLEIPGVRDRFSPITVAEYHRLSEYNASGRRTELIRGIIVEKMSKSPLHSSIARRLFRLLQAAVPPDFTLLREDPLSLADSEPEPDLAIVRGSEKDFANRHPSTAALVIEIAVSSAAEDRSLAALYAEAGVEEYWIVLPAERRIEVHRTPQTSGYRDHMILEGEATVDCQSLPSVRIRLAEVFG